VIWRTFFFVRIGCSLFGVIIEDPAFRTGSVEIKEYAFTSIKLRLHCPEEYASISKLQSLCDFNLYINRRGNQINISIPDLITQP